MKRLTLLRHAKSGDDGMAKRDFDRPLNAKGRKVARAIGRYLRDEGAHFDRILASPALRVAETLEEVSAGYGPGIDPAWERRIYLGTADELLDVLHEVPDEADDVLLVGHNPGLEELVLMLVPEGEQSERRTVQEKYPTASVAEIDLDTSSWARLTPGSGRLKRFTRPRDLDPAFGPDQP
ncbi:phosphohistidine phosphatase [Sphingomonas vulcanisoli]|uniref:Phosphohistidine phosphatase n=1 Tax=Sphingomonas vulcanisoli TaxID=1658060 RepID=A0ABX0TZE8_9SPHN|nr:histidine phosphatase family protein [Sphingomonas vulcanisoli]NIJ09011.1 phosphohistidine phosphatase [Sphingomonas vulcanisoli]